MTEDSKNGVSVVPERRPARFLEQMEREFDEMRRRTVALLGRRGTHAQVATDDLLWAPTADAYEADGALVIKAELPGVKKENVTISVDGGYLTVTANREEAKEAKDTRYYTCERFVGAMRRSFALPDAVDTAKITAKYTHGVLEIHVPLPEQAKTTPVTIAIQD